MEEEEAYLLVETTNKRTFIPNVVLLSKDATYL